MEYLHNRKKSSYNIKRTAIKGSVLSGTFGKTVRPQVEWDVLFFVTEL